MDRIRVFISSRLEGALEEGPLFGGLPLVRGRRGAQIPDIRRGMLAGPFTEHEQFSLKPADLIHVPIIGGRGSWADPFAGIAGLSLAAIAIWSGMGRKEVLLFILLGIGALLYAMAGSDALYGPLYAFLPLVEKTREPIVAVLPRGHALEKEETIQLGQLAAEAFILYAREGAPELLFCMYQRTPNFKSSFSVTSAIVASISTWFGMRSSLLMTCCTRR